MNILLAVIGGLILLVFPFILLKKSKSVKAEGTDEAKKKYNLFLICMMPVPLVGFVLFWLGLRSFM